MFLEVGQILLNTESTSHSISEHFGAPIADLLNTDPDSEPHRAANITPTHREMLRGRVVLVQVHADPREPLHLWSLAQDPYKVLHVLHRLLVRFAAHLLQVQRHEQRPHRRHLGDERLDPDVQQPVGLRMVIGNVEKSIYRFERRDAAA